MKKILFALIFMTPLYGMWFESLPIIQSKSIDGTKTVYQGIIKQYDDFDIVCQVTYDKAKKEHSGIVWKKYATFITAAIENGISSSQAQKYYNKFLVKEAGKW